MSQLQHNSSAYCGESDRDKQNADAFEKASEAQLRFHGSHTNFERSPGRRLLTIARSPSKVNSFTRTPRTTGLPCADCIRQKSGAQNVNRGPSGCAHKGLD